MTLPAFCNFFFAVLYIHLHVRTWLSCFVRILLSILAYSSACTDLYLWKQLTIFPSLNFRNWKKCRVCQVFFGSLKKLGRRWNQALFLMTGQKNLSMSEIRDRRVNIFVVLSWVSSHFFITLFFYYSLSSFLQGIYAGILSWLEKTSRWGNSNTRKRWIYSCCQRYSIYPKEGRRHFFISVPKNVDWK